MTPKLSDLFFEQQGKDVDKWEQYIAIYERELSPFLIRATPVDLLEIGTQNGGSLELWSQYLPKGSTVTGLDVEEAVGRLKFSNDAILAHVVDATDKLSLEEILSDRQFDIIIDDGSHRSSDIIRSFDLLFRRLKPSGLYIIEDLHCSYHPIYEGAFRAPGTSIEALKNLIDAVNADHVREEDVSAAQLGWLRDLNRSLARITFYDSVAVIEKLPFEKARSYRRIYSGLEASVMPPTRWLRSSTGPALRTMLFGQSTARRLDRELSNLAEEYRTEADLLRHESDSLRARAVTLETELSSAADRRDRDARRVVELAHFRAEATDELERLRRALSEAEGLREASRQRIIELKKEAERLRRANVGVLMGGLRSLLRPSRIFKPGSAEERVIRNAGRQGFDAAWYLSQYPDVARAGADPIAHYLGWGTNEGRNPHPDFDTRWYLAANPDVARSGLNPLVHFILHGRREGRAAHPIFGVASPAPQEVEAGAR